MQARPEWYGEPNQVIIPVREDKIVRSPLGNEMSVTLRLSGEELLIYIPTWAYDEENSTIPAVPIWEMNGKVLFRFPATTLGTPQCSVPKEEVESWLKQEVG